jgi:3'(2'), 5'-bisphosphate nucleotidase
MTTEHEHAAEMADLAGAVLLKLRERLRDGADQKETKDLGDRTAHLLLMDELSRRFPRDAVLSEEGKDDFKRLDCERVWIIDPLDGTREFGEIDRTDWAVHVALCVGGVPVVGAVALPAQGITLSTGDPLPLPARPDGPMRILASRTRPPAVVTAMVERLGAILVPMGSAGAKATAVLLGLGDAYVHGGGQYEWDSCAPVAVVQASGLHASRLNGDPLVYNRRDVLLPDLAICRPELADEILAAIADLS